MSGSGAGGPAMLAAWSSDVLAVLALLSAIALLVSQYARAGRDILALIERARALFRARRCRRLREHRD